MKFSLAAVLPLLSLTSAIVLPRELLSTDAALAAKQQMWMNTVEQLFSEKEADPTAPSTGMMAQAENVVLNWLRSKTRPDGTGARKDTPPAYVDPDDEGFSTWFGQLLNDMWTGDYNNAPIGKWFASILPVQRFDKKVHYPEKIRPGVSTRYKALYGPIDLVAKDAPKPKSDMVSLDPNGQAFINVITDGICMNCTILAGQSGLVDADTLKPLSADDGVYIHHVITQDLSKPQIQPVTICDNNLTTENRPNKILNRFRTMAGSGFVGQGDDNGDSPILFTTKDGKFNSGFHTGMNDKYVLYLDMVNYTNTTKKVYFAMDIEYVDGHEGGEAISTLISVTGCNFFKDPKAGDGPTWTNSANFPILQDSSMISAKGHMHDGGEAMVLYINDKEICRSTADYGSSAAGDDSSTIRSMSWCPEIINVKKGDVMRMSSLYDLKKHPLREATSGAGMANMGTMGGMDLMGMWAIVWALDPKATRGIEW